MQEAALCRRPGWGMSSCPFFQVGVPPVTKEELLICALGGNAAIGACSCHIDVKLLPCVVKGKVPACLSHVSPKPVSTAKSGFTGLLTDKQ